MIKAKKEAPKQKFCSAHKKEKHHKEGSDSSPKVDYAISGHHPESKKEKVGLVNDQESSGHHQDGFGHHPEDFGHHPEGSGHHSKGSGHHLEGPEGQEGSGYYLKDSDDDLEGPIEKDGSGNNQEGSGNH